MRVYLLIILAFLVPHVSVAQAPKLTSTTDGKFSIAFPMARARAVEIPSTPRQFADQAALSQWLRDNTGSRLISLDAKNGISILTSLEDTEMMRVSAYLVVAEPVMAVLAGTTGKILVGDRTYCVDPETQCAGDMRTYLAPPGALATPPRQLPEAAEVCFRDDKDGFCIDVRSNRRPSTLTAKTSMLRGATDNGRVIVGAYFQERQDSKIVSLRDERGDGASETVRVIELSTDEDTLWCGYHWAESGDGKTIGPVQTAWRNPDFFNNDLKCPSARALFGRPPSDPNPPSDPPTCQPPFRQCPEMPPICVGPGQECP
ncbi:MAG: hypothetical protein AAGA36_06990 [Pseudomonadota bacterium]